ncbi:MAG: carotenoid biosynthesis protein [Ilumatobacteraceae bacterium]
MVATPLAPRGGSTRRHLSTLVVCSLFGATLIRSARRWGGRRAGAAAATVAVSTAVVERIGTATGVPFGRYAYSAALRPHVADVPVIVPLAWFAMAVPARETASAVLGTASTRTTRVALGSAALTAWDLFLDPQMVGEDYWRWRRSGAYRGVPVSNYVGWVLTGFGVMAALEFLLPPGRPDPVLTGEYAYMATMETVGFAAFFRDPVVAAVGGVAMVPLATAAVGRLAGRWPGRAVAW